ncbi:MAG: SgcJ/EcaC family oxidoreductase [Acidobacteria bacterium]|nr:SgcJ/EcaC family oxidoreductase [Acidobacteriota bacterium]
MRICLLLLTLGLTAFAASPEDEIRAVLDAQVEAWNRGDVEAFMTGYAESPDTLFVGKEVRRGYQAVLERYRRDYPDKGRMGTLRFSDLEVRPLGPNHASVLGRFHLTRAAADGGDAQGIFTLVFERSESGWKVILDHTS